MKRVVLEMETTANQKVSCLVNFAYDASEADELTMRPGDVIRDVERLPGGWWRGELRGRRGMFPDNFVSVTEQTSSRPPGVQGRCRAVFSYQPVNPDELPLSVGDVLEVLGEVEEGWWQGRRQGRVGVFPSNFVVMLDPQTPAPPFEPAPALPPKPVKELCRVLFPYSAVNEDELTLSEGDIVTILSKDAPDRGWWRGELHGRVGLFPDNFVQALPAQVSAELEEKKPDRPPVKTSNSIYPSLTNKYSEKTASVKELPTSKISVHKENAISKDSQSAVTVTNKSESEKIIHSDTFSDGSLDQVKKPPVPLKKSPTPTSGVGGLFSGFKNKMLSSTDKEKSSSTTVSSGSSSGGEWDRPDGAAPSKTTTVPNANSNANNANTFDHIERNSLLNDPRAGRVKAPRRRPPSQALRDDTPQLIGLSNGHEAEKPPEKAARTEYPEAAEEIKPRTREWEKHKAPWMAELKLNQAKKTSFIADGKSRLSDQTGVASKTASGSTDRILDVGLEEKRSTHSMEMSKSTSSISNRMSVLESFEETKVRHSLESRKEATPAPRDTETHAVKPVQSPTAAGRTIMSMLDEIKKPQAPPPPTCAPPAPPTAAPPPSAPTSAPPSAPTSAPPSAPPTSAPPAVPTSPIPHSATLMSATILSSHIIPDKSSHIVSSHIIPDKSATIVSSHIIPDKSATIVSSHIIPDKSTNAKPDKSPVIPEVTGLTRQTSKTSTIERIEKSLEKVSTNAVSGDKPSVSTLERRMQSLKTEKVESNDALIAQLNNRVMNLEKLMEVQNTVFNTAIEDLKYKLSQESEKRQALQAELEKLAQCVTQV